MTRDGSSVRPAKEVSYENKTAGIRIAGTLTKPRSQDHYPAVLLIAGSDPMSQITLTLSDERRFEMTG